MHSSALFYGKVIHLQNVQDNQMEKIYALIKKAKQSKQSLWLLNQILKFAIPFNKPHGFKITAINDGSITTFAPYHKKNFNHLRGIHACAIATVGELAAGLSLMNHFSPAQYRFIMSHMDIDYHYQAKKSIFAHTMLSPSDKENILNQLKENDKILQEVFTEIHDIDNEKIATVKTVWQIKDWNSVKTKR